MDERKLKSAFSKVKSEMNVLGDSVAKLQMQVAQSVRDGSSKSDESLVDTVKNLEVELNSIKKLVSTLSKNVVENANDNKEIKSELKDLKEDLDEDFQKSSSNEESVTFINSKLTDFQELINTKITLEIAELRLEMSEEIATAFDNMTKGLKKVEKKVSLEKKSSKSEEILENDEKILSSNQKTLIEEVEYKEEEKKPSRFKKAINWLFVDEDEEDDLESLKQDMTDGKDSLKNKKKK